ncbi:MAG: hypothetical protein BWK80_11250 [Desulfobacteraceae bacterium IS3]|nr:MAG: hypothetical protein BWK80_11250 [Desulfobacteraceae bacterium IS3]
MFRKSFSHSNIPSVRLTAFIREIADTNNQHKITGKIARQSIAESASYRMRIKTNVSADRARNCGVSTGSRVETENKKGMRRIMIGICLLIID